MYEKYIKGLDSQENQLLYIQISIIKCNIIRMYAFVLYCHMQNIS